MGMEGQALALVLTPGEEENTPEMPATVLWPQSSFEKFFQESSGCAHVDCRNR